MAEKHAFWGDAALSSTAAMLRHGAGAGEIAGSQRATFQL